MYPADAKSHDAKMLQSGRHSQVVPLAPSPTPSRHRQFRSITSLWEHEEARIDPTIFLYRFFFEIFDGCSIKIQCAKPSIRQRAGHRRFFPMAMVENR